MVIHLSFLAPSSQYPESSPFQGLKFILRTSNPEPLPIQGVTLIIAVRMFAHSGWPISGVMPIQGLIHTFEANVMF